MSAARDREVFAPGISPPGATWEGDHPVFTAQDANGTQQRWRADYVIGETPLQQYVVSRGDGRYQVTELAFDPAHREWFDVFGSEGRHPGEWGHWTGRGMNWNSMCAHCHFTEFRKNYDAARGAYASTWLEQGVGCIQCHGSISAEHLKPGYIAPASARPIHVDRKRMQETCAPCHARNELLTGHLEPGVDYSDAYRLELPIQPQTFYPDGQVRDEDYNYTSLMISPMGGRAGVTCLDCHNGHTGRTRLPAADNSLCMDCHKTPGREQPSGIRAPVIEPLAHSHHKEGSTGNQCITCHMPTTTYMARDPRHDHGFLKPDPLLTRELGIPNACDRCHAEKGTDWSIEWAQRWYDDRLDSRQRKRARAVHAIQNNQSRSAEGILALLTDESIPAWRAAYLQLLRPYASQDRDVILAARSAAFDKDPMVRSAATQVLGRVPSEKEQVRRLLDDPERLVRLDAAWALSPELPDGSMARTELDAYFHSSEDQPAGLVRTAQDAANRGQLERAESLLRKADLWDPLSPGIRHTLGLVLDRLGRPADAAAELWRAAELAPQDADLAFQAGLAFAAVRDLAGTERALRAAVTRDPHFARAWYNLGLLQAQMQRADASVVSLQRAADIDPTTANYPYALATVLWQQGNHDAAREAARRALAVDPNHPGAQAILAMP